MNRQELFTNVHQGSEKIFYSIYADIQGAIWIKFWGHFIEEPSRRHRPWRIQEYFGAEFRLEDYLCVPRELIEENLTEIKQTIGDLTEDEALYDMNHFFEKYCFPPLPGQAVFLPLQDITMDTPCGLYIA